MTKGPSKVLCWAPLFTEKGGNPKIRLTVPLKGDFLSIDAGKYEREFRGNNTQYKTFSLRACFVLKEDADKWAWVVRQKGNYARTIRLSRKLRWLHGENYQWGVWVREIHTGTVSNIEVVGSE